MPPGADGSPRIEPLKPARGDGMHALGARVAGDRVATNRGFIRYELDL